MVGGGAASGGRRDGGTCSGAQYSGVPTPTVGPSKSVAPSDSVIAAEAASSPLKCASPKSSTQGCPWLDQDVRRLQIAVDNACLVGMVHGLRDIGHKGGNPAAVVARDVQARGVLPPIHSPPGGSLSRLRSICGWLAPSPPRPRPRSRVARTSRSTTVTRTPKTASRLP